MSIYDYLLKWEEIQRDEGEWDVAELALSNRRCVPRASLEALRKFQLPVETKTHGFFRAWDKLDSGPFTEVKLEPDEEGYFDYKLVDQHGRAVAYYGEHFRETVCRWAEKV